MIDNLRLLREARAMRDPQDNSFDWDRFFFVAALAGLIAFAVLLLCSGCASKPRRPVIAPPPGPPNRPALSLARTASKSNAPPVPGRTLGVIHFVMPPDCPPCNSYYIQESFNLHDWAPVAINPTPDYVTTNNQPKAFYRALCETFKKP